MAISTQLGFKSYLADNWIVDPSEVTPVAAYTVLVQKPGFNTLFRSTGAAGEVFSGVLSDRWGASASVDDGTGAPDVPVTPDQRPNLWMAARDADVLIEDSATVGVGDLLSFSTITPGTLRTALAGEAPIMRASTAITSGGIGLTVKATTVGGAFLGGTAPGSPGALIGATFNSPLITVGVEAANRIPVTVQAQDAFGANLAGIFGYSISIVDRITLEPEAPAAFTGQVTTGTNFIGFGGGTSANGIVISDSSGLLVFDVIDEVGTSTESLLASGRPFYIGTVPMLQSYGAEWQSGLVTFT